MLQYPCVKYIYHIDYGVIQGFPALRKTTQLKKYDIFSHVFDIANQLLTRHSRHSVKMMNEASTILNPGSFVGVFSDYGCWNTKKSAYRQLGSKFPRRRTKPNTKRKTESYVFSGFGSGISCGWERNHRQLEDLPQANIGRLSERLLLSVRTKSINENFVDWKLRPLFYL